MRVKKARNYLFLYVLISICSLGAFDFPFDFIKKEVMSSEDVAHLIPILSKSIQNFPDTIATKVQKEHLNKHLETAYKRYLSNEVTWEHFHPILNWYSVLPHLAHKGEVIHLKKHLELFDKYISAEQHKTMLLKGQVVSLDQQDEIMRIDEELLQLCSELGWLVNEKVSWWSRLRPWQRNVIKAGVALSVIGGGGLGLHLYNKKSKKHKQPDESDEIGINHLERVQDQSGKKDAEVVSSEDDEGTNVSNLALSRVTGDAQDGLKATSDKSGQPIVSLSSSQKDILTKVILDKYPKFNRKVDSEIEKFIEELNKILHEMCQQDPGCLYLIFNEQYNKLTSQLKLSLDNKMIFLKAEDKWNTVEYYRKLTELLQEVLKECIEPYTVKNNPDEARKLLNKVKGTLKEYSLTSSERGAIIAEIKKYDNLDKSLKPPFDKFCNEIVKKVKGKYKVLRLWDLFLDSVVKSEDYVKYKGLRYTNELLIFIEKEGTTVEREAEEMLGKLKKNLLVEQSRYEALQQMCKDFGFEGQNEEEFRKKFEENFISGGIGSESPADAANFFTQKKETLKEAFARHIWDGANGTYKSVWDKYKKARGYWWPDASYLWSTNKQDWMDWLYDNGCRNLESVVDDNNSASIFNKTNFETFKSAFKKDYVQEADTEAHKKLKEYNKKLDAPSTAAPE